MAISVSADTGSVATWTGAAWVTEPAPVRLALISCGRTDRCLAATGAGPVAGGGPDQLAAARVRDGRTWRPVPAGAPAVPAGAVLSDLSCWDGGCFAVGHAATAPLAFRFDF